MAGVTLPAGVLIKPCCASGIGGFVLEKHMGAVRSVMPTSCVCKNGRNRSVCAPAPCLVLLKAAQPWVGAVGLGWQKPHGGFQRSQVWAGVWVLKGAVSHSGVQLWLLAGAVLLPAPSGTSRSCPRGELQSRWRFPLDQSAGATWAIAAGSPDPARRRAVG